MGRRKRKWDQPAEQLVAAGVVLPRLGNAINVPPAATNTVAPFFQTPLPKLIQVIHPYPVFSMFKKPV